LFRAAGAALTRRGAAAMKHGGGGRTSGMFRAVRLAPQAFRNAAMIARRTAKAHAPAVFLSDTLDWLQVWHVDPAAGDALTGECHNAGPNHLSPGL
jgi:hypothetical protein